MDSADLMLVQRWASEGHLPFFRSLIDACPLVSLSTPSRVLQGAVWPSLMTGASPGQHGLYLQRQLKPGTYEIIDARADHVRLERFYQTLSEAGVRCGLADIPADRPVRKLNGLQIVDWGVEFSFWGYATYPASLAAEIRSSVGEYPIALDRSSGLTREKHLELRDLLHEGVRVKGALGRYLLSRDDLDLIFMVFMEPHKSGHWHWKYHDRGHPDHDDTIPELRTAILDCYRDVDRQLAALAELLSPADNLIVFSDHGMQPDYRGDHLAEPILARLGLLAQTGIGGPIFTGTKGGTGFGPLPRLKRLARSILRPRARESVKSLLNLSRIDWKCTQVFRLPTDRNTYLRVNLIGREPKGTVAPGAEYERLLKDIEQEFRSLINTSTGRSAVVDVCRPRDLYPGDRSDDLPDIVIQWSPEAPIESVSSRVVGTVSMPIPESRTGNHRDEGFLLARGPAFAAGRKLLHGSVLQIAPTLLRLHGVPIPEHYEMGPLAGLLANDEIARAS